MLGYLIGAVLTGCLGFGILAYKAETRDFEWDDDKFLFYFVGAIVVGGVSALWPFLAAPALTAFAVKYFIDKKKANR